MSHLHCAFISLLFSNDVKPHGKIRGGGGVGLTRGLGEEREAPRRSEATMNERASLPPPSAVRPACATAILPCVPLRWRAARARPRLRLTVLPEGEPARVAGRPHAVENKRRAHPDVLGVCVSRRILRYSSSVRRRAPSPPPHRSAPCAPVRIGRDRRRHKGPWRRIASVGTTVRQATS